MSEITVMRSDDRTGWSPLVDPPGENGSGGAEIAAFTSADGAFTCGLWEREPDTWSFARPHDEVAYILSGSAELDTASGQALHLGAGDVLVTPNGSMGTWRIGETLTKFYAIRSGAPVGDPVGDTEIQVVHDGDPVEWVTLETAEGDPNPPGEEWYAYRSADGRFSTGVWRRAPETGPMELTYDEVAILIEGEVEVEAGGAKVSAGPGDVVVTPSGFTGTWRARSSVRKFWTVYHG